MPHKKKYEVTTVFPNYDLHGAAAAGNIGLVLYALRNGQPIDAVLGGLLPLHAAASGGSASVVQLLIDRGADVNAPRLPSNTGPPIGVGGAGSMVGPGGIIDDGHGTGTSTAGEKLHKGRSGSASGHAQPPVTPMARPGSSNTQLLPIGRRGSTALHFAAALGHGDVIRILLENGANPAAKDVDKSTPEMVARANGKKAIADFLREWQATAGNTTEAVRRSFESPISTTSTQNPAIKVLGTASDLRLNAANNSTASLPLAASTPPASHSTSSLGRYPNSGRRPSLPSIYESPPSTSYPRPSSGKKQRSPERPATATSMHPPTSSALAKLPFTIRRPKSAGNRDARSGDDASSQHSHASSKAQNSSNTASRLNRIFKRPNLRPATASGALSTSPSPTSPSPPVITRSRSPSASRITDKDNSAHRNGGLFHGHHLPHLHRRDHGNQHPHLHHLHVSRDAISGPIMDGSKIGTSIPDISRPDLLDVGQHNSSSAQPSPGTGKLSASPDDVDEDEAALYRTLNLTPAEIQYAKSRGALPDRLKSSARTAPPGQSSFGIGRKASGSGLNRYPSHQGLSNKATTLPSPHIVPRHRAHLGPNGGMAMTSMEDQYQQGGGQDEYNRPRAETPLSFGSTTMDRLSPAPHAARPVASYSSLRHEVDNRVNEIRQPGDGAGSISSLGSHLSGSILSNDHLRSPEATEDLTGDYMSRPFKAPSVSTTHSPGGTSPSIASPGGVPFVDGRMISSRAQAQELVEAQRRAIQAEHRERIRAKRLASASSHRTGASHLAEALAAEPADLIDGAGSSPTNGESEDENASLDEDDVNALREKLAALGETAQIERRFARGEQQAKRWNRESGLDDASAEGFDDFDRGVAASLGASMLTRNEMLAGYLGQKELVDTERVKRPSTPKRDVFGRPVTPKKEGRPPTPKENRPATPKNPATPTASRMMDAPRENRILPPASKSQAARPTQHLTLQQTRAISKSDLGLSSHFNKDDVGGRERAWTTTDVRPRAGPASNASRPSTAGAKPSGSNNGGLTIDIIQTMPTPTDASSSPLRKTPGTPGSDAQRESLQSRRRYNSNPLRIDAKAAQEKALTAKESPDEAPQPSPNVTSPKHQPRQQSGSKTSRKPSTPTKEQPAVLLHRITTTPPPAITLAPPAETPFGSFLSVSSNGGQGTPDRELPPNPVPALPSAVSLHNMHVARAREEALKFMENQALPQGSPPDSEMSTGNWNATAPSAAERRLGLGLGNQNGFGYESVRSFNEEKGGDKSYRLLGLDNRDSDTSTAGKSSRSKLGGLFSRLKR